MQRYELFFIPPNIFQYFFQKRFIFSCFDAFCLVNRIFLFAKQTKTVAVPRIGASSFPLFAKQTKTVAVPRDWGQPPFLSVTLPPFLSVSQTKAGSRGKPCTREGAKGKGRIKGRAGRGQKKEGGLWK